jgi:hypothetical protein
MLHKLSMITVRFSFHCAMITVNSKESTNHEKYVWMATVWAIQELNTHVYWKTLTVITMAVT